jgi:hypothetical protein
LSPDRWRLALAGGLGHPLARSVHERLKFGITVAPRFQEPRVVNHSLVAMSEMLVDLRLP